MGVLFEAGTAYSSRALQFIHVLFGGSVLFHFLFVCVVSLVCLSLFCVMSLKLSVYFEIALGFVYRGSCCSFCPIMCVYVRTKRCYVRLDPQLFVVGFISYLCYLCFLHTVMSNTS